MVVLNMLQNLNKNINKIQGFDVSLYEVPFVDSPFYKKLSKKYHLNNFKKYTDKLNADGYCVVDLEIEKEVLDKANNDIDVAVKKNVIKLNSNAYHYNSSPRIVEAWKFSDNVKALSVNKKILDILKFAYQSEPIPFSTINFIKGTEQPMHSDEFHFGSLPHRYLSGCWIALEDVSTESGPLSIAKGSHKFPVFSYESIGLDIPKNERDFKHCYTIYEQWVKEMIEAYNIKIVTPKLKKGQCIIWLSNTLHGAFKIKNQFLTRKSLVVHYHYKRCETLFYPSYSNLKKGKYIPRSMKNLDIRYLES